MKLLSEEQRAKAIEALARAPDEILLSAMVDFRRFRHLEEGTRANFNEVADQLTERRQANEPVDVERRGTCGCAVQEVKARTNVSPGTSSIGKIGGVTRDTLIAYLAKNQQPPAKYAEHMKLLWARGEIKFDGTEYYL